MDIDLTDDEARILEELAVRQQCTPTEVITKALYQVYPQFSEPKKQYRKTPSGFDEGYSILS